MLRSLVLVGVVACTSSDTHNPLFDPSAPSADGTVSLAPGVSADGFTLVAIRLYPLDASLPPRAVDLELGTLPQGFSVGHGIGASSTSDFGVSGWLATMPNESQIPPGAPHAAVTVDMDCDERGNCQGVSGVELVLAP